MASDTEEDDDLELDGSLADDVRSVVLSMGRDLTCSVCLSYFKSPTMLPCNHALCEVCAHQIIATTKRCPTCRTEVTKRQLGRHEWIRSVMTAFENLLGEFDIPMTQNEFIPQAAAAAAAAAQPRRKKGRKRPRPAVPSAWSDEDDGPVCCGGGSSSSSTNAAARQPVQRPSAAAAAAAAAPAAARAAARPAAKKRPKPRPPRVLATLSSNSTAAMLQAPSPKHCIVDAAGLELSLWGVHAPGPEYVPPEPLIPLVVGDCCSVIHRVWPGSNKHGGAAVVTAVSADSSSYGVKYVVDSRREKGLEARWVQPSQLEAENGRESRGRGGRSARRSTVSIVPTTGNSSAASSSSSATHSFAAAAGARATETAAAAFGNVSGAAAGGGSSNELMGDAAVPTAADDTSAATASSAAAYIAGAYTTAAGAEVTECDAVSCGGTELQSDASETEQDLGDDYIGADHEADDSTMFGDHQRHDASAAAVTATAAAGVAHSAALRNDRTLHSRFSDATIAAAATAAAAADANDDSSLLQHILQNQQQQQCSQGDIETHDPSDLHASSAAAAAAKSDTYSRGDTETASLLPAATASVGVQHGEQQVCSSAVLHTPTPAGGSGIDAGYYESTPLQSPGTVSPQAMHAPPTPPAVAAAAAAIEKCDTSTAAAASTAAMPPPAAVQLPQQQQQQRDSIVAAKPSSLQQTFALAAAATAAVLAPLPALQQGCAVNVAPRMGPGSNKPGGVALVTRVHSDSTYDVKYVLSGHTESHLERALLSAAPSMQAAPSAVAAAAAAVRKRARTTSATSSSSGDHNSNNDSDNDSSSSGSASDCDDAVTSVEKRHRQPPLLAREGGDYYKQLDDMLEDTLRPDALLQDSEVWDPSFSLPGFRAPTPAKHSSSSSSSSSSSNNNSKGSSSSSSTGSNSCVQTGSSGSSGSGSEVAAATDTGATTATNTVGAGHSAAAARADRSLSPVAAAFAGDHRASASTAAGGSSSVQSPRVYGRKGVAQQRKSLPVASHTSTTSVNTSVNTSANTSSAAVAAPAAPRARKRSAAASTAVAPTAAAAIVKPATSQQQQSQQQQQQQHQRAVVQARKGPKAATTAAAVAVATSSGSGSTAVHAHKVKHDADSRALVIATSSIQPAAALKVAELARRFGCTVVDKYRYVVHIRKLSLCNLYKLYMHAWLVVKNHSKGVLRQLCNYTMPDCVTTSLLQACATKNTANAAHALESLLI
jgi:Zinc finger, C3HC4 type (RING finger)